MIESVYLVQTQEPGDPIAFKAMVEGTPGKQPDFINTSSAYIIETAQELTGDPDPQARVLADLYKSGTVSRENGATLGELLEEIDPAATLQQNLNSILVSQDACNVPEGVSLSDYKQLEEQLSAARHDLPLGFPILTRDGLLATDVNLAGEAVPYVNDRIDNFFDPEGPEQRLAQALDLRYFGFQYELVGYTDKDQLRVQSGLFHVALGELDESGVFHHMVSIPCEQHPIAQGNRPDARE